MVTFDKDFSQELCGGTHVGATGEIGLFKILSESGVAAGIRRIEAVTGDRAKSFVDKELKELNAVRDLLKNPKDLAKSVASLQDENRALKKQIEQLMNEQANALKKDLLQQFKEKENYKLLAAKLPLTDGTTIKNLAYQIEKETSRVVIVFGAEVNGKPQLTVVISKELTESNKDLHAGNIIRELAKSIKGGGGGQPFFATAGGKDVSGLDAAIEKAGEMLG